MLRYRVGTDGGTSQELHLQRLMTGITSWLDPPEAVVGSLLAGSASERWVILDKNCFVLSFDS